MKHTDARRFLALAALAATLAVALSLAIVGAL